MARDVDTIMAELESLGTEQNRNVYPRHGAREPLFGVSYKHMGAVAKRIGRDHALAEALWLTGNHDARVLATKVADPALLGAGTAEAWIEDAANYPLVEGLAKPLSEAVQAPEIAASWRERDDEWVSSAGWAVTAHLALRSGTFDDAECARLLDEIEARIAGAPNRTRHEMNGALIAIGSRGGEIEAAARAAAERIGPVEVDHGQTGCKTPAAIPYLDKIAGRRLTRH